MRLFGEWAQDSDDAPLVPLGMGPHGNASGLRRPQLQAYFSAMVDVDGEGPPQTAMNMSGTLTLSIDNYESWSWENDPAKNEFPSKLDIALEGVYSESEEAGGERVMCMLGSAELPSYGVDPADSDTGTYRIPLLKDDNIILVVRHPKSLDLTRREIKGEMMSLHHKSAPGYFGKVQIALVSDRYATTTYKFSSGNITAKACSPYPHPDNWLGDIQVYKGQDFCNIIDRLASGNVFTMWPNWICDSTNENCRKMWPFQSMDFNATHGSSDTVWLAMTDLRCKPKAGPDGSKVSAKVASLFMEILPLGPIYDDTHSTSLSRPIVSSEGIWDSSSGQLCMVACAGADPSRCNLRICLYVPTSFSLTQRSTIVGSISSISESGDLSNFSFSLGGLPNADTGLPTMLLEYGLSYEYSKTNEAGDFLRRDEVLVYGSLMKKVLLKYPRMNEVGGLCHDLGLSVSAFTALESGIGSEIGEVRLKILTLGSKICHSDFYPPSGNSFDDPAQAAASLLNVSAELAVIGHCLGKPFMLSLEGLYSHVTGKMYLVGCRVAPVPWKTALNITEWQHLDCETKVEIQFPPTTLRWLTLPTATISIESIRSKDNDPLYFDPFKLQTSAVRYRGQDEDVLSERRVELVLRISTLLIVIACILSQLFYVKDASAAAPYISHVMLGVQALGYGLPLITGAEALIKRLSQRPYGSSPHYYLQSDGSFQIVDIIVKSMALTAFLLTLRLWQKVQESRIRLPRPVPSDKRVLVACSIVYAIGFLVTLIINPHTRLHEPTSTDIYTSSSGPSHGFQEWGARLEQYAGLVQDFFLLPQVVGSIAWQINCRPLRKTYYLGVTLTRLLPHAYDYIRAPIMDVHYDKAYGSVCRNLGSYSRTRDVVIALVAGLLAVVVYLQQRCGFHGETKRMRWLGFCRLWSPASVGYDSLTSVPLGPELMAGAMETDGRTKARKDSI